MDKNIVISKTINFVKAKLDNAESGHDWFHIERVWKNAKLIAQDENVDLFTVELGALLHDIADSKFHNGDESIGPEIAKTFLKNLNLNDEVIEHVCNIIRHISFKNSLDPNANPFTSPELKVIQDADRLDAIGAIGIARAFNYGGYKNRLLYDPKIKPNLNLTKEEYKKSDSPTINHFYEKLLLLKDQFHNAKAKEMALQRHDFMEKFLSQFYHEWNTDSNIQF